MSEEIKEKFKIGCRAVIINDGKLLVVKLPHDTSYYCLPGGHLEFKEDIKECLKREIKEELGVEPEIGRLLYIHGMMEKENWHSIGFYFEVTNGSDYIGCEKLKTSHSHEIAEIYWANPTDDIIILPKKLAEDFKQGRIFSEGVKYINDL